MNKKIKLLLTLFFLHISHLTASQAQQPQAQQSKAQQPKEVTYYFSMCVPFAVIATKANISSDTQTKPDVKTLDLNKHVEYLSKLYGFTKLDR